MIRRNQKILNAVNMLLDAALVFCAYLLATYIRFDIMAPRLRCSLRGTADILKLPQCMPWCLWRCSTPPGCTARTVFSLKGGSWR